MDLDCLVSNHINFLDDSDITTDRLDETYAMRIPQSLKQKLSELSPSNKKKLNNSIMVVMAYFIHMNNFRPNDII